MWSNMTTSWGMRSLCDRGSQPVLEDLALAARSLSELTRRNSGRPMERSNEVREIVEPHVERHVGDRGGALSQQPRRPPQPGPDQVLVGRHAERPRERPQEVVRAQARLRGRPRQIDRLVGVLVQPERRFYRSAAVARAGTLPLIRR